MISFKRYGAKRLLELAKLLDGADALHEKRGEPTYSQTAIRHECGTPACAIGHWGAANPKRFKVRSRLGQGVAHTYVYASDPSLCHETDQGVAEFGITREESYALFSSWGCGRALTGKAAAAYIRKFVKDKLKEFK